MQPRCPHCGKDYTRRTRREGLLEQIASVVYVYPFRCQLCRHRFRVFEFGRRYERGPADKREYDRLPTWIPATLSADALEDTGVITDLSIAGCAVQTGAKPEPGALIQLSLRVSESALPIVVEAAVVRAVHPAGLGLQFLRISAEDKERLSRQLQELYAAHRRKPA